MAITHRASSGIAAGTTTTGGAFTLPTGHTADDLLLAWLGCKPYTVNVSSGTLTTDYTALGNITSGTVANGVGVGSTRTWAYHRTHDGSETAPDCTLSAAPSPSMKAMSAYSKTEAGAWDIASATGADTSASGTSVSIASGTTIDLAVGDVLLVAVTLPDDTATMATSLALTASGITFGTITERLPTNGTTSGNDAIMHVFEAEVTAGSGTVTVTLSGTNTNSGESEASAVFVRLREPSGSVTQLGDGTVTVTPTVTGGGYETAVASGSVTVTPSVSGSGAKIQTGAGTALSIEPVISGTAISYRVQQGEGTVTVVPVITGTGTAESVQVGEGTVIVTPTVTGTGRTVVAGQGAALSIVPVIAGTGQVQQFEQFASGEVYVQPVATGSGHRYLTATGVPLYVVPDITGEGIATPDGGFIMAAAQLADARAQWQDANIMPDAVLTDLLEAAWTACLAYLPTAITSAPGFAPEAIPSYVKANVLHARDLFQAESRNGDVIGFDQYAIRVRPLSDTVRSLLRPPTGRALVG